MQNFKGISEKGTCTELFVEWLNVVDANVNLKKEQKVFKGQF